MGNKISISRFSISNYESGKKNITARAIKDICREFNVSHIWLTQGVGEMFEEMDSDDELMTMIDNLLCSENETAKTVFKAFAKLEESDWIVIQKLIENLKK